MNAQHSVLNRCFSLFEQLQKKYSYLDVVGRTVVVLEKNNLVPEHSSPFQVSVLTIIFGPILYRFPLALFVVVELNSSHITHISILTVFL